MQLVVIVHFKSLAAVLLKDEQLGYRLKLLAVELLHLKELLLIVVNYPNGVVLVVVLNY